MSSSISSHFAVWSPAPAKWPLFSFASNQSAPYLWLSSCLQCFKLSVHHPCPSPSASVFEPIYLLFFLFHLREPASCMSIAVLFQLIWDGCQVWDLHIWHGKCFTQCHSEHKLNLSWLGTGSRNILPYDTYCMLYSGTLAHKRSGSQTLQFPKQSFPEILPQFTWQVQSWRSCVLVKNK